MIDLGAELVRWINGIDLVEECICDSRDCACNWDGKLDISGPFRWNVSVFGRGWVSGTLASKEAF